MKKCKNCGKEIRDNMTFCSEKCAKTYDRNVGHIIDSFKIELKLLEKSVSKKVELGMSRGPSIKGRVVDFDNRYGKIIVETVENGVTKNIIVKLGYVVSFAVYD
jgi:hypothetical protein